MGQVRIRKSSIHGYGVFADRDLYSGEVIHYEPRSKNFHGYNHSCNPNAVIARINHHEGYPSNTLIVLHKDVPKGTEVTVDYGMLRNQCNCQLHKRTKQYKKKWKSILDDHDKKNR